MVSGPSGGKTGKVRPFENLKTEEIIAELTSRMCTINKTKKDDLIKLLKEKLEVGDIRNSQNILDVKLVQQVNKMSRM